MAKFYISLILSLSFLFSQDYNYSGKDINPNSSTFNQNISPNFFTDKVTITYFGHQN
tara:strand:- start:48 stop:218 length:171 start_codon:yes stop_codon:yes gene_type:complete